MSTKIAVIMAHPDDAEIWVGGTLLHYANNDNEIMVHYCFCNKKTREIEASLSAKKINAKLSFTNKIEEDDLLIRTICEFNPSLIITHWEGDSHTEHLSVFNQILRITPILYLEFQIRFNLYSCDCYNSLGRTTNYSFMPTDYVDISDVWNGKIDLISSHKSQPIDYFTHMIETQNRLHGARVGVEYAEAFIQIPIMGVVKRSNKFLRNYF
jgi:N-acetylglucosamine malate deacetylase 1